ncbi:ribokinase-like [Mizuhopecten yessoensis]|uniref:Ribokinase n=1 Tax=Mizuhopecten yessoensis TaxID=6573 RepID=A0A210QWT3_MIZYE|nr:ribokinase-like [Mizuhopecten yessoensis]OWF53132.1 Ribokinase [Mizuhopecten yessoensis]
MDVTVIGSCMTDLVSYVPRLPKPGETLHGTKFAIGFGGKGANQCIVAARLGAKTAMVAKVGDDTFGKDYIQNFKDNQVMIEHVEVTSAAGTGVAPICVNQEGQNSIVIVAGANLLLTEDNVRAAEAVVKETKIVVCQLEIPAQSTLAALKLAKKHNVRSIFNPAPAQSGLSDEFFSECHIFCANETEAEILTGLPVKDIEGACKATLALLDKGCSVVILTLGVMGSVFATQENRKPIHVAAQSVTAVDTTGAGDAFVGALAYYLSNSPSLTLQEIIQRSTEVAGVSVQSPGTQTSFPWKKDLPPKLFS